MSSISISNNVLKIASQCQYLKRPIRIQTIPMKYVTSLLCAEHNPSYIIIKHQGGDHNIVKLEYNSFEHAKSDFDTIQTKLESYHATEFSTSNNNCA